MEKNADELNNLIREIELFIVRDSLLLFFFWLLREKLSVSCTRDAKKVRCTSMLRDCEAFKSQIYHLVKVQRKGDCEECIFVKVIIAMLRKNAIESNAMEWSLRLTDEHGWHSNR